MVDRATPPLTALLIATAVLFAALWLRGQYVSDTLRLDAGGGTTVHAFCGQGSVAFALTSGGDYFKDKKTAWTYAAGRPPVDFRARWANLGAEVRFHRAGFVAIREPARGTTFGFLAPCLPVAAALASVAAVRVAWYRLHTRRRRRILAGLCPACGHDMLALTERCSNCGRPRARGGMRIGRVRNSGPTSRAA